MVNCVFRGIIFPYYCGPPDTVKINQDLKRDIKVVEII